MCLKKVSKTVSWNLRIFLSHVTYNKAIKHTRKVKVLPLSKFNNPLWSTNKSCVLTAWVLILHNKTIYTAKTADLVMKMWLDKHPTTPTAPTMQKVRSLPVPGTEPLCTSPHRGGGSLANGWREGRDSGCTRTAT